MADAEFASLIEALKTAPTAPGKSLAYAHIALFLSTTTDARAAADKLAREVAKQGPQTLA